MKVLQINTTANTGSTGRIAEEIGLVLQQNGHESYIACGNVGENGSRSHIWEIGNDFDFYMHGLQTRLFDRHGFGSKKATIKLVEYINEIDPDVINLHNLHGYYLNIEVLFEYLQRAQKPVIWTLHDCWPFTGHCSFFDFVSCSKWKTECHNCPLSDKYPASWLVDNSRNNFRLKKELFNRVENLTIVTPSYWLAELVDQSFLSGYPVEVIHNGVDLSRFKSVCSKEIVSKYKLTDKKMVLGVASVWDRRKGLEDFMALSKILNDDFRIVLIGLPQSEIDNLPENIIGIQRTENIDELVSFYSAADVFVNPTWVDNFPTTNLEALACGTPVITYKTGGSPEAIDPDTGFVVGKGNIKEMSRCIVEILEDDKNMYQESCRKRAVTYFDKADRYQDYLNLFQASVQNKYLNSIPHASYPKT